MTTRRDFLGRCAAALAVLAVGVKLPERWTLPVLYGDGVHDDWPALQAMVNGARVWDNRTGRVLTSQDYIERGTYALSQTLHVGAGQTLRMRSVTLKAVPGSPLEDGLLHFPWPKGTWSINGKTGKWEQDPPTWRAER